MLLAVSVVGEQFKTMQFSATGTFSGKTTLHYAGSPPYIDIYSGTSNDQGSVTYISPTRGFGSIQGSGSGSGSDNYNPGPEDRVSYTYTYSGSATLEDDNGQLVRANASGTSTTGSGGTPYTLDTVGTVNVSSIPFQASVSWSFPVDDESDGQGTSTGSWSGSITPTGQPFDIHMQSAQWVGPGMALFDYVMPGVPHVTGDRSSPVAQIEVRYSMDETGNQLIGEPLGTVPVYWNQASGQGQLVGLTNVPPEAEYVVFIANADGQADEASASNNVASLKIYANPTVAIEVTPKAPEKRETYEIKVNVTNHSHASMNFDLEWEAQYPSNAGDIQLIPAQAGSGTLLVDQFAPGETREVTIGPLEHYWDWIPKQNPVLSALNILKDVYLGLKQATFDLTEAMDDGSKRLGGYFGRLLTVISVGQVVHDLLEATPALSIPVDVVVTNPDGHIEEWSQLEPVEVTVPEKYRSYFESYILLNTAASETLAAGMRFLLNGQPHYALGLFSLALGAYDAASTRYEQALDPPDPDYTVLAVPEKLMIEELGQEPLGFSTLLADIALELQALGRAEAASRNKADGALAAGDRQWQHKQLLRASDYADQQTKLLTRQIARETLFRDFQNSQPQVSGDELALRLHSEGLPVVLVNSLTDSGWSETAIDSLRQNAVQLVPHLTADDDTVLYLRLMAAMTAYSSALELEQAITIGVEHLQFEVLDLPVADQSALDALRGAVETDFANGAPSLAALRNLLLLTAETRRILLETNNVEALHPYVEYAYGAIADFQTYRWNAQILRDHIDGLHARGHLPEGLAESLHSLADAADEALRTGDFAAAARHFTQAAVAIQGVPQPASGDVQSVAGLAELLSLFVDASPWQHNVNPLDVNGDGSVFPVDALIVINRINQDGSGSLPSPLDTLQSPEAQYDTSGDNILSPVDVLLVINELNRPLGNAEGEPAASVVTTIFNASSTAGARLASSMAAQAPAMAVREVGLQFSAPMGDRGTPARSDSPVQKAVQQQLDAYFAAHGVNDSTARDDRDVPRRWKIHGTVSEAVDAWLASVDNNDNIWWPEA